MIYKQTLATLLRIASSQTWLGFSMFLMLNDNVMGCWETLQHLATATLTSWNSSIDRKQLTHRKSGRGVALERLTPACWECVYACIWGKHSSVISVCCWRMRCHLFTWVCCRLSWCDWVCLYCGNCTHWSTFRMFKKIGNGNKISYSCCGFLGWRLSSGTWFFPVTGKPCWARLA